MGVNHLSANVRNVSMGAKLKLATWNCGGLSYTQRELCVQLGYDILALTETHDAGQLRPSKHFLCMYVCMYTQYSDSVNFQVMTITQRDQH